MSIYQSLFDLLHAYIYGGVTLTPDMNLVCTLIATICCVGCALLPFAIVWAVFKRLTR